jgi:hypothetical protein
MKFIISFLILIIGCKKPNIAYFVPNNDPKHFQIQLSYGEAYAEITNSLNTDLWGPYFDLEKKCIYSHNPKYIPHEFGLILSLCFPETTSTSLLLENLRDNFLKTNKERISIYEKDFEINFKSLREIINLINDENLNLIFLGDQFLKDEIDKEKEELKKTFNIQYIDIHNSFGLPYFSILKNDSSYLFLYLTGNLNGQIKNYEYLVIQINEKLIKDLNFLENFTSKILSINNRELSICKKNNLEISEAQYLKTSKTGKFIEFTNPFPYSICPDSIELYINGNLIVLEENETLYFPNETIILGENSNSPNNRNTWKNIIPWKEIDNNTELKIGDQRFQFNKKFVYRFEEEEFSERANGNFCNTVFQYLENRYVCSDPGISILKDKNNSCGTNDFILTEINYLGLKNDTGKNDTQGKFIELQYTSEKPCDLSSIIIDTAENQFNLSASGKEISPNTLLLIGNKNYFSTPNLIHKNLSSLKSENIIQLVSKEDSKSIFNPNSINKNLVLETYSTNYSVSFSLEPKIHNPYHSSKINPEFIYFNNMSPGEIFSDEKIDGNSYISEIFNASSINNGITNPSDKFLELYVRKKGEFSIKIIGKNNNEEIYEFPYIEHNGYITLSREKYKCFLEDNNHFIHPKFNYPSKEFRIELYSNGSLLDSININSDLGMGQDKRNNLSISYSRVKNTEIWKNSHKNQTSKILVECYNHTYASPSTENNYSPFLVNNASIHYPDYLLPIHEELEIYSPDLEILKRSFTFYTPSPIFDDFISNIFTFNHLMKYGNWKTYPGNLIFYKDGLIIKAINPNPENQQNEWVLICNNGKSTENILDYTIVDSNSSDKLVPLGFRMQNYNLPKNFSIKDNSTDLVPGQCGYILDPDFNSPTIKSIGIEPVLLFTVEKDRTIGNGLGVDEPLNLYKTINQTLILSHSYGNSLTPYPFKISAGKNEIILLKENRLGEEAADYERVVW